MAYLVTKIVRIFTGEINDLNNLFGYEGCRGTGALFIGKERPDRLHQFFRFLGFYLGQAGKCQKEAVARWQHGYSAG